MSLLPEEIVVVIPIYQNNLNQFEQTSLDFCKKHLNNYSLLVVSPTSLSKDQKFDKLIKKEKFDVVFFDNKFFDGIEGYNKLMLNVNFYGPYALASDKYDILSDSNYADKSGIYIWTVKMEIGIPLIVPKNLRKTAPVYPIRAEISSPNIILTLDRSIGFNNVSTIASESLG